MDGTIRIEDGDAFYMEEDGVAVLCTAALILTLEGGKTIKLEDGGAILVEEDDAIS